MIENKPEGTLHSPSSEHFFSAFRSLRTFLDSSKPLDLEKLLPYFQMGFSRFGSEEMCLHQTTKYFIPSGALGKFSPGM